MTNTKSKFFEVTVTDYNRSKAIINSDDISTVRNSGTACKWHGTNCYIHMKTGKSIGVEESVEYVSQFLL